MLWNTYGTYGTYGTTHWAFDGPKTQLGLLAFLITRNQPINTCTLAQSAQSTQTFTNFFIFRLFAVFAFFLLFHQENLLTAKRARRFKIDIRLASQKGCVILRYSIVARWRHLLSFFGTRFSTKKLWNSLISLSLTTSLTKILPLLPNLCRAVIRWPTNRGRSTRRHQ